jgi:hypothetical protein
MDRRVILSQRGGPAVFLPAGLPVLLRASRSGKDDPASVACRKLVD